MRTSLNLIWLPWYFTPLTISTPHDYNSNTPLIFLVVVVDKGNKQKGRLNAYFIPSPLLHLPHSRVSSISLKHHGGSSGRIFAQAPKA